jgi:hypothetical protein
MVEKKAELTAEMMVETTAKMMAVKKADLLVDTTAA